MGSIGQTAYCKTLVADTLIGNIGEIPNNRLDIVGGRTQVYGDLYALKRVLMGGLYQNTHRVDVISGTTIDYKRDGDTGDERSIILISSVTGGTIPITLDMGTDCEELGDAVIEIANVSTTTTYQLGILGTFTDGTPYTPGLNGSAFPYTIPPQTTCRFSLVDFTTWRLLTKGSNVP